MKRTLWAIVLGIAFAIFAGPETSLAQTEPTLLPRPELADRIGTRQVSFLAKDLNSGNRCALADSDLDTRHAPWSTFKIPNLLIAVETGVADGLSAKRKWDQARRPASGFWPAVWRQDHTLETAFRHSAVWYFRDIALDVGSQTYRQMLRDWSYGNATVPDRSDSFWLDRTLKISVTEQVTFLEDLLTGDLDVSPKALAALAKASKAGTIGDIALHGKTGAGTIEPGNFDGPFEGWYVGWLARDTEPTATFALHVRGESFQQISTFRKDFAQTLLAKCGLLPG